MERRYLSRLFLFLSFLSSEFLCSVRVIEIITHDEELSSPQSTFTLYSKPIPDVFIYQLRVDQLWMDNSSPRYHLGVV